MHEYRLRYCSTVEREFMQTPVLYLTLVTSMLKITNKIIKSMVCHKSSIICKFKHLHTHKLYRKQLMIDGTG
jgi:hypothetical protein